MAKLECVQGDGATLRQHLEVVRKATGEMPPELNISPIPRAVLNVWNAYQRLAAARGSNGYEPDPIGWEAMRAMQEITGEILTPWEADTIISIDRAVRATINKKG